MLDQVAALFKPRCGLLSNHTAVTMSQEKGTGAIYVGSGGFSCSHISSGLGCGGKPCNPQLHTAVLPGSLRLLLVAQPRGEAQPSCGSPTEVPLKTSGQEGHTRPSVSPGGVSCHHEHQFG